MVVPAITVLKRLPKELEKLKLYIGYYRDSNVKNPTMRQSEATNSDRLFFDQLIHGKSFWMFF